MTATKRQLSVTVSADLVADLERRVRAGSYLNRSAAIEAALRAWSRQQRSADLHAYYDRLGDTDASEQLQWAELGRRALTQPATRKRRVRR
jgi:Arc/MetJ-type ribon-helix-helix transcriptional regulator